MQWVKFKEKNHSYQHVQQSKRGRIDSVSNVSDSRRVLERLGLVIRASWSCLGLGIYPIYIVDYFLSHNSIFFISMELLNSVLEALGQLENVNISADIHGKFRLEDGDLFVPCILLSSCLFIYLTLLCHCHE